MCFRTEGTRLAFFSPRSGILWNEAFWLADEQSGGAVSLDCSAFGLHDLRSNWKHSFHMRPRWNFNLITALSRNRTRVTEVKGTCANHRTTNTPTFTHMYFSLLFSGNGCTHQLDIQERSRWQATTKLTTFCSDLLRARHNHPHLWRWQFCRGAVWFTPSPQIPHHLSSQRRGFVCLVRICWRNSSLWPVRGGFGNVYTYPGINVYIHVLQCLTNLNRLWLHTYTFSSLSYLKEHLK